MVHRIFVLCFSKLGTLLSLQVAENQFGWNVVVDGDTCAYTYLYLGQAGTFLNFSFMLMNEILEAKIWQSKGILFSFYLELFVASGVWCETGPEQKKYWIKNR